MKITIISHDPLPEGHVEVHRFTFQMLEEGKAPNVETVSVRTARVLAKQLETNNPFVDMLTMIGAAKCADYPSLVGRTFEDASLEP